MRIIRNTTETDENHPRIYVKTKEDKTADGGDTQVFIEKVGGGGLGKVYKGDSEQQKVKYRQTGVRIREG